MGEHQTITVSKTLEEHSNRLNKTDEQLSSISMILNDFVHHFTQFTQFEIQWKQPAQTRTNQMEEHMNSSRGSIILE